MMWKLNRRSQLVQKQEMLGLDFGMSGLKAVRLRRSRDQIHVVAADILPGIELLEESKPKAPVIPESLRCSYAAVCVTDKRSILRVLTLTGTGNPADQIREQIGAGPDIRFVHVPLSSNPARWMAASLPQSVVDLCLTMFRSGPPAVCDLELSGMATLTACMRALGDAANSAGLCVMDVGFASTFVFFLNQRSMVLVRKYDIGTEALLTRIGADLDIDRPTSVSVLREGAIDLSPLFREVLDSTIWQIVISRDFVERQEKCQIGTVYCSGALSASPFFRQAMRDASGMDVALWNPFEGLVVSPEAVPQEHQGMETRFAAAVGAALGVMTASP